MAIATYFQGFGTCSSVESARKGFVDGRCAACDQSVPGRRRHEGLGEAAAGPAAEPAAVVVVPVEAVEPVAAAAAVAVAPWRQ